MNGKFFPAATVAGGIFGALVAILWVAPKDPVQGAGLVLLFVSVARRGYREL